MIESARDGKPVPYERYRTAVYFVGNGLRAVPFIDLRCIWNGTQAVPYECLMKMVQQ